MVAAMMLVGAGEEAAAFVHAGMVVSAGCPNGCRLRTVITGSSTEQNSRPHQVNLCMESEV